MSAAESISSLIAEIYDAALDPSRWGSVLENSAKYVGGSEASLHVEIAEIAPHQHHFYHRDHWQKNLSVEPSESGRSLRANGTTLSGNVLFHMNAVLPAERLETKVCERPLAPGSTDGATRCVARFTLHRPGDDDAWIEVAEQRLQLIFPHLRRAVQICKAITTNRATVAALEDMLDGLDAGVFLVNALGQMVDANSSGNAMLKYGRLSSGTRGRRIVNGREATSNLRETFMPGNSRWAAASVSDRAEEQDPATDGTRYVVRAFPIAAAAERQDGGERSAVAGMILRHARPPTDDSVERISRHYRLAPRERQVLQAIVDGYGVTQISYRLAIAHSTAKTYLSRLFGKTCTKNRTDLIKLCAAFRSPFSGCADAG